MKESQCVYAVEASKSLTRCLNTFHQCIRVHLSGSSGTSCPSSDRTTKSSRQRATCDRRWGSRSIAGCPNGSSSEDLKQVRLASAMQHNSLLNLLILRCASGLSPMRHHVPAECVEYTSPKRDFECPRYESFLHLPARSL